jgi:DNA-directed RNA polymerase subunit RPC12/RpoP
VDGAERRYRDGPMPSVTCPRCHARQSIDEDADGYTCERCGTAWAFATCENCGTRFHMPPGTTSWTCPNCGYEHEPAAVERRAPAHAAPPGPAPQPDARAARRLRLGSIAVAGIVAVVIGAFALTRGGSTAPPAPTPDPIQALCLHLRDLQTVRVDALTRVADAIAVDADAIEASGNPQTAAAVRKLRRAVLAERDAVATQDPSDDQAAAAALAEALTDPEIPC